jgi:prophage maintenance system killer protein
MIIVRLQFEGYSVASAKWLCLISTSAMSCTRTLKFRRPFSVHKTSLKAFPRTSSMKLLTISQIKLLNARVVGPVKSRLYNEALLEYAVISQSRQRSHEQEKDLNQLAAGLASNLIKYNVFQSGCKKTALLAACLFRLENGMALHPNASHGANNDTIVDVHNRLASGAICQKYRIMYGGWELQWRSGVSYQGGWECSHIYALQCN